MLKQFRCREPRARAKQRKPERAESASNSNPARSVRERANLPRDNPTAVPTATFVLGHCYQNEVTGGWMCLPQEEPDRLFRTTLPRHIPRSGLVPTETFPTRFITARRASVEFHN